MMGEAFKIELMDEFKAQGETNFSFYINTIPVDAKERLLKDAKPEYIKKYEKLTESLKQKDFITFIDMCE
jgi:hypothetical protein